jgi:glycosyltransferase involved in cell wall biosynthesis
MIENKKTKVCFLIPSIGSGGLEVYTLRFIKFLNGEFDITIVVRNSNKAELYEDYEATGVNLEFMPLGYYSPLKMLLYYKYFKKMKFDIVCDLNSNFAGIPMMLSKWAGIPKRIAYYGQSSHHFKPTAFKIAYNNYLNCLVDKYSTSIFSNSITALKFFFPKQYPSDSRLKVIRNGIELKNILSITESKEELKEKLDLPVGRFIIGHTGRFTEAKNHYFFLDVAKKLLAIDKNFYFVFLGKDTPKLESYAEKLGIRDNISTFGFKNNIPEYLKAFDIFFFPSVTEGQPNALIEAMAAGTPVVASNIQPIIETLPENGLKSLVSPTDVNAAVTKIMEVKKNLENYTYQEYAVNKYAPELQFKIFKDSLLHN